MNTVVKSFKRIRLSIYHDSSAATAVEIALIMPCFLLIIFAWIEIGFCLLILSTLDNAARDASRLIRTGTATEANFKAAICAKASPFIPCDSIVYYVQSGTSFTSLAPATASGTGTLTKTGFNAGSSGSNILLQVGYSKAPLSGIVSTIGFNTSILLMTTLTFQNEAY